MALLEDLNWRYSVKKYDPTQRVSDEDLSKILEAIRLSPTSSGLQQFRVIVITNQEMKEKLVPIAYNQQIVAECSHLLVFAAWDKYTAERIDNAYDYITEVRGLPQGRFNSYTERLKAAYLSQPEEQNFIHTARQAYIGLGLAVAEAAELKVDSTPVEGFDNKALDEFLNLGELGLRSVLLLPLGYRDEENDWLLKLKKVRIPKEEFVIEYK
jgi:nitroreductase